MLTKLREDIDAMREPVFSRVWWTAIGVSSVVGVLLAGCWRVVLF